MMILIVAARVLNIAFYDSKYKFKKSHNNLNLLRNQLIIDVDKNIILPRDSVFQQGVLRAVWHRIV